MKVFMSLTLVLPIFLGAAACGKYETTTSAGSVSSATAERDRNLGSHKAKRIFYTSQRYTADLGGLAGADAKCAQAANSAQLGGRWVAWLSDSHHDALNRVQGDGPWVDNGADSIIFPTKASLRGRPSTHFGHDEYGVSQSIWYFAAYWTGTGIGGRSSGKTCGDWHSLDPEDRGTWGAGSVPPANDMGSVENGWTALTAQDCLGVARLLCFEL